MIILEKLRVLHHPMQDDGDILGKTHPSKDISNYAYTLAFSKNADIELVVKGSHENVYFEVTRL